MVCRQLGYSRALNVHHSAYYGQGDGSILMDNVQCQGNESRLDECAFKGWGVTDCNHANDAGVVCQSKN